MERKAIKDYEDAIQQLWNTKLWQEYQSRTKVEKTPVLSMQLYGDHSHSGGCKSAKKQTIKNSITTVPPDPKSSSDKKNPTTQPLEVNYVPRI